MERQVGQDLERLPFLRMQVFDASLRGHSRKRLFHDLHELRYEVLEVTLSIVVQICLVVARRVVLTVALRKLDQSAPGGPAELRVDIGHASRLGKHKEYVHTEAVFTDVHQLLSQIFDKLFKLRFMSMVLDSDEQLGDTISLQQRDCLLL